MTDTETRILEHLAKATPITTRRIGCIGVYADTTFFAIVKDQHAYFKTDAHNLPIYKAVGTKWPAAHIALSHARRRAHARC